MVGEIVGIGVGKLFCRILLFVWVTEIFHPCKSSGVVSCMRNGLGDVSNKSTSTPHCSAVDMLNYQNFVCPVNMVQRNKFYSIYLMFNFILKHKGGQTLN